MLPSISTMEKLNESIYTEMYRETQHIPPLSVADSLGPVRNWQFFRADPSNVDTLRVKMDYS